MIVVGLTGGIGMGKSTAAGMLRRLRVPVHDADATVHRLMAKGGAAVTPVAKLFPDVLRDGAIDRKALGRRVFGDRAALRRLEKILHPLVRRDQVAFLRRERLNGAPIAVLDIPLLYETGGARRVDKVITISAPSFLQRRRVLSRAGMTASLFASILTQQAPDSLRRREADYVVRSGLGRAETFRRLKRIVEDLRAGES
ncbi:MAG TPA: dephospho-CoA kinase [Stellaceae bacterium]|nr:dephospho-CoA kinase [Stellaceae bacterium]